MSSVVSHWYRDPPGGLTSVLGSLLSSTIGLHLPGWTEVSTGPDEGSRDGKTAVGPDKYGLEVINCPPLQRKEDTENGHPLAGPWSLQDGAPFLDPLFLLQLSRSFYLGRQLLLGLLSGVFLILIGLPQCHKVSSLGMIL
jgi:hypothetical protein